MKSIKVIMAGISFLAVISGCGGTSGTAPSGAATGVVSFNLDLTPLGTNQQVQAPQQINVVSTGVILGSQPPSVTPANNLDNVLLPTITTIPSPTTTVTVTLTNGDSPPVTRELTVSNNFATGKFDNLDARSWHVSLHVVRDQQEIYAGETDTQVIAGNEVHFEALFNVIAGRDWGGADLIPANGDLLTGTFTNVGRFSVGKGESVYVGDLSIQASSIQIDGALIGPERTIKFIADDQIYLGPTGVINIGNGNLSLDTTKSLLYGTIITGGSSPASVASSDQYAGGTLTTITSHQ